MIPIKLQIEGFLSYQLPATINFESIHLACISGSNGAGKSSILDAITWVLFGIGRSRNDDVINQNSNVASIHYIFSYESQTYQIHRSKEREKPLILELNIFDEKENRWKVFTEHSSTETQKKIISILRLDYDTFVNASFFLQGKADMFTILKPSERKEILANILGLEVWETYRIGAREKHKALELDHRRIKGILEEIESELLLEESVRSQLSQLANEANAKNESRLHFTLMVEQAKQIEQSRLSLISQINMQETDLKKITQKQTVKNESFLSVLDQIKKFEAIIENQAQIEVDFENWNLLKGQLENWDTLKDQFTKLDSERNNLQFQINKKKNDIETRLELLEHESSNVDQSKNELNLLTQALERTNSEILKSELELSNLQNLNLELEHAQTTLFQKKETIKQLSSKNDELRNKLLDFQKAGPECPFCNQPLTQDHRHKFEKMVTTEGVERKTLILDLEKEIQKLNIQILELKNEITEKNKLEKQRQNLEKEKAKQETQIQNLTKLIDLWENNKVNELHDFRLLIVNNSYALEENKDLLLILTQIELLGYDVQKHKLCKESEFDLRQSDQKMRELEQARSTLLPLVNQRSELEKEIVDLNQDVKEKQNQMLQMKERLVHEFSESIDSAQLQKQLDQIQIEINQINLRIGGEKQKLESISKKKVSKENYLVENNKTLQSIARYKKLEDAFSKNGIPALLIEQALPQIEEHANILLDRLTNGAMSIRFETQSEYKDKKRLDKKETLDIKINDLYGNSRSYEMFSGGEAFRINFAIRIALSQVLASRSGAKLQTLVIDEGFGSQDSEGQQRLIDVISRIKNDFAKILIITHLDNLKDVFPARIDVEKTNMGSQISVQVA